MNEWVKSFTCDRCGNATRKLAGADRETLCAGCLDDQEEPNDSSENYDDPPFLYDANPLTMQRHPRPSQS